ncbi:MAG: MBL fold metallo-hydrolase [Verrucomicrobiae bacterium]|nr:MBL fold metallo-hydrolase [Verrucomicrobiae bacterium]
MQIPLEDFYEDIVGKAMRGLGVGESQLAAKTGVDPDTLRRLCRGEFSDETALAKVARALDLDPGSLLVSASKAWRPRPVSVDGLTLYNTPYRDMRVNAFLIADPHSGAAAVFDTGTDSSPILAEIENEGLRLEAIFITHTHNDHIADLERLRVGTGRAVPVFANRLEPWEGAESFDEGKKFAVGGLTIETRTTSGHSIGGTTYVVTGLERPVAVVGDAMFAGSMGGGMISHADALGNNREKILTLPDETVLCPGHGPLTTVGEEKRCNPFFPEFKG